MNPRTVSTMTLAATLLALGTPSAPAATTLDHPSIKATVDLGEATFFWKIPTAPGSDGGNVTIQIFLQTSTPANTPWSCRATPPGRRSSWALVPDGSDNSAPSRRPSRRPLWRRESNTVRRRQQLHQNRRHVQIPPLNLTVKTDAKRVTAPVLTPDLHGVQAPGPDGKRTCRTP